MATPLLDSINGLADQLARLALTIDRLIAIAESQKQHTSYQDAETKTVAAAEPIKEETGLTFKTDDSEIEHCSLVPLDEEIKEPTPRSAENAVASSIADLHDRLGGLLQAAFQPPDSAKEKEIVRSPPR